MRSPTKLNDSADSNSCADNQTPVPNNDRTVNIVSLGKMEEGYSSSTTITVRCRETVIKFTADDPVSAVCALVRSLESGAL